MEMNTSQLPESESRLLGKEKKGRKKWILLILLLVVILAAGGVTVWKLTHRTLSQYEIDANALAGFLPGKSSQEIQDELNRIVAKGYFNITINPTPVIDKNGTMNINIENVPANHYWMQVNVYLIQPDGKELLLYQSGVVKQGFHISTVTTKAKLPPPGKYNGRADFNALQPDTQESIGATSATMLITVQGAKK